MKEIKVNTHLVDSELYANRGHDTQQTRCKTPVESPDALFFHNSPKAVINSSVSREIGIIHLRYKSCLYRVHRNHDTHSRGTSNAAHDGVFDVRCRAQEQF
jgi:hypothetical protein